MRIVIDRKSDVLRRTLFLCEDNFHASRFCEELFNSFARTEGLNWQASSRSLERVPAEKHDDSMSASAIAALRSMGVAPVSHFRLPLEVTEFDFQMSHLVVAIDLGDQRPAIRQRWPDFASQIEHWNFDTSLRSQAGLKQLSRETSVLLTGLMQPATVSSRPRVVSRLGAAHTGGVSV